MRDRKNMSIKLQVPLHDRDKKALTQLENDSSIRIFGKDGYFESPQNSPITFHFCNGHIIYCAIESGKCRDFSFLADFLELQCFYLDQHKDPTILDKLPVMSNLHVLGLMNCNIPQISKSILRYPAITHLDFSNNRIKAIPNFLSELIALRTLDLGGNKITKIPNSIKNLKNLTRLNLEFNEFTTIPQILMKMNSLRSVSLLYNPLPSRLQEFGWRHGMMVDNIHHPFDRMGLIRYLSRFPHLNSPMDAKELREYRLNRGSYRDWYNVKPCYWKSQDGSQIYFGGELSLDKIRD
jgi:hypothetical protein